MCFFTLAFFLLCLPIDHCAHFLFLFERNCLWNNRDPCTEHVVMFWFHQSIDRHRKHKHLTENAKAFRRGWFCQSAVKVDCRLRQLMIDHKEWKARKTDIRSGEKTLNDQNKKHRSSSSSGMIVNFLEQHSMSCLHGNRMQMLIQDLHISSIRQSVEQREDESIIHDWTFVFSLTGFLVKRKCACVCRCAEAWFAESFSLYKQVAIGFLSHCLE